MRIYSYSEEKGISAVCGDDKEIFVGTSICLGGFDGIHKGHKALFDVAKSRGKWGVLLFDRNIKGNENLTTQTEKIKLIENCGADYVIIAEYSEKFSKRTPVEFVQVLENILKVSHIVCGYDYRFGYMAKGDAKALKELCEKADVTVLEPVMQNDAPIKSTDIRTFIKKGDISLANELLGYNYTVSGKVEKGLGNGRKMGFPTANIAYSEEKLLPADGVYYGKMLGRDAVINIGKNPTFEAEKRTVEVHIPDFSGDLYGENVEVEILEKIRDDIKFDSIDNLIVQINKDIDYVKGRKGNGQNSN
ncbi:MAG: bifunctional riboflavin kinase/FAD synthetase [Clostridia bacterium]|nr:bifunctional riboflavin kinase/FAD synthetase [Clostridia bacterium]